MKIFTSMLFVLGILTPVVAAPLAVQSMASVQIPEFRFRAFEDDAGGFYVVWTDSESDKTFKLRAQHISSEGQALWGNPGISVATHLTSFEDWHGLADGQGGLTLFWDEQDGVHAQRFRPDGNRERHGNSVLMSTSTAIQPAAVPDALGGTLVVWREKLPVGRSVVMAQRLDKLGKPVWPRGGIRVSLRASDQTNPRVVYDNMSGMMVGWRDEVNNASELRVQRIDFIGTRLWGESGLAITAPLGNSQFPEMAAIGTGEIALAWTAGVAQTNQILLQKVGPDPTLKWGTGVYVSTQPATSNRWNGLMNGDDSGGVWIAWEDYRNDENYQIYLNRLNAQGASFWLGGDFAIAPAAGDQGKMTMTTNASQAAWMSWIDNRQATVGLYVQAVDQAGNRLLGKSGQLIVDHLNKPSRSRLVLLGAKRAAVIWADRPNKDQWTLSWAIATAP